MKEKKLLARLGAYLDLGAKRRKKQVNELKELLKKLRKKEKAMIGECRKAGKGEERDMLEKRYLILHAQRLKGQKALKKIGGK
ncbi:MAG: hypothetical protein U9R74_04525 [Pseudomonadota bacterium]|nr:hypothetical protein [Pseudomonadota bacterium]